MQVPPAAMHVQLAIELLTLQLADGPQVIDPPACSQFMVHLAFSHLAAQLACLQVKVHAQPPPPH